HTANSPGGGGSGLPRGVSMNRFRAALAVAATAAAAVAITPASAHPRTPVAAAGQTVVRAAQTGYVDLSLPDDVRVSTRTADNPDLEVSGPGRLVGFWLYRLDTTVDSLLAVRLAGPAGARVWSAVTTSTPEHGPCTKWPND